MDCNKDEAARAKEKAEEKFTAKDIMGAKKLALKAQNLFPGLEGISQMLATLDVYISAENKVNGEVDWYAMLGVDPRADEETVRKHYRKLALILHPDKNKSIGADGAFKLISQAWSMLSDKAKRVVYDQKRNGRVNRTVSTSRGNSSSQSGRNGFYNFTKNAPTSSMKGQKSASRPDYASASSQKPRPTTFWTVCHRCKMQYEYLRIYLNHNLLCPNCHEPFFALETPPPPSNGVKSNGWDFTQPNHRSGSKTAYSREKSNIASSSYTGAGESNHSTHSQNTFQWGPFSRTGGASSAAQAATVVQQAYEKVKREREEAQAAKRVERRKHHTSKKAPGASSSGYSGAVKRRRGIDDISSSSHARNITDQLKAMERTKLVNLSGCTQGNIKENTTLKSSQDVSLSEIQNLLIEKAKKEMRKMLCELKPTMSTTAMVKEGNGNEKVTRKRETSPVSGEKHNNDVSIELLNSKRESQSVVDFPSNSSSSDAETMLIDVPDSDFHNFDRDRTESSFRDNQIWAAYDDHDGMPRRYAWIHSVVSLNPFKMQIHWLNSIIDYELGALSWVSSGFPKTCGGFRTGRCEIYSSINAFSHKVRWSKGTYGDICIYPRKGDVWALYRNWSPDWNELTSDEVIHKYDMVEVLEDYSEELGVIITPLIKVAGFKAVFHRDLDPNHVRRIPKDEMFRFSHLVPSHLLTGQESPNAPKGCRELDPAATPVDLLHIVETPKEEFIEIEDLKLQSCASKMVDISDEKMEKKPREARKEDIVKPVVEDVLELKLAIVILRVISFRPTTQVSMGTNFLPFLLLSPDSGSCFI
ncbi:Chaperone protein dnaJ 49, partial [Cucurbita argyrosperma subsp. sororia]